MITPKYFNPTTFFVPYPSQEFLLSVHLVFYVTWVYRGNYFAVPVYNDVLGPVAAQWGYPCCFLKTNRLLWADIVRPLGFFDIYTIPILDIFCLNVLYFYTMEIIIGPWHNKLLSNKYWFSFSNTMWTQEIVGNIN